MAVKKTIAIVASEKDNAINILAKLAIGNFRLLVISKDKSQFTRSVSKLKKEYTHTELTVQDCVKDGCWEADMIILNISLDQIKEVGERIREVATQKVVIIVNDNILEAENIIAQLKVILINSRLISASKNLAAAMQAIENNDEEDIQIVLNFLQNQASVF